MQPIFRLSAYAGILLALGVASGCTVRPLMADTAASGAVSVPASNISSLRAIDVLAVGTREAQEIRNHLIFLLHGGAKQPANPLYTLTMDVTRQSNSAVSIQTGATHEPTAGVITLIVNYTLQDIATGDIVARRRVDTSASFDRPRQEYAVVRAERDAENRAARELAELVRLSLAQDFIGAGR